MNNQLEEYRSRLRESLVIINDLKAKVAAAERGRNEPLAIIGMSCRLPGGSNSLDAFWDNLLRGVDAISEIPATRWAPAEIEDAGNDVRWAGLIEGIDQFDASFFGISPREAASLDPQHRLLLEVSWEAIEDAALRVESLSGSKTGVYVGICTNDYWQGIVRRGTRAVDTYGATGNLLSTAAGRISYWLGLEGPCASVDTACSSSLVALNFAINGLLNGGCDQAIVAGVNAILSPFSMTMMSRLGALSQDGRCKTFDARANGYVRGEGCGVIVIKRLSDARRDGDRIHAVILGSAVNQDGRSTGLTTPNVLSQQALLRNALENARITAEDIGYIETHGTGTPLGDPIELDALKAVLGRPRPSRLPIILGALKTNIGHLEGAAGISGLIKAVLCLERQAIPKNLHQRALNPRIALDGTPFVIPRETTPWPRAAKPRRAGISSFGISGTNAHIILEEAPPDLPQSAPNELSAYLLPISSKSSAGLSAMVRAYAEWLSKTNDIQLDDLVHTAGARHTHYEYRFAVTAQSRNEFLNSLRAFVRNEPPAGIAQGRAPTSGHNRLLFVFSGQGSQWAGMGKSLLAEEPVFRAKLEEIATLVQRHAQFSLLDEITAAESESRLGETEIVQPAIFAIQVGIAELLKSWGIAPDAVLGHSVGEIAAAHVSGALTLEEAVRLVVLRGRIMQKATGQGKMVWVSMTAELATRMLSGHENRIAIAAINDPSSVVLSGESNAIDTIVAGLEQRGIVTRPLRVNYAFHSPQMDPFAAELIAALGPVNAKAGTIPHYSTVTAAQFHGPALNAEYWGRNIRATVNLADAARKALSDGYHTIVEIGSHPVLLANLQQCASAQNVDARILSSLRRNAQERRTLLELLGALHVNGHDIHWRAVCQQRGRVISLPHYEWQKERFWIETQRQTNAAAGSGIHPLLGMRIDSSIAPGEHVWQQSLSVDAFSYLDDHRVQDDVVFPGAGYVEMVVAATAAIHGSGTVVVDEMALSALLALPANSERQMQAFLQRDEEGFSGIAISSRGEHEEEWIRHATAKVRVESNSPREHEFLQVIEERCVETIDHDAHYASMTARKLHYGKAFRGVQSVRVGHHEALGRISLLGFSSAQLSSYRLHPALLDACLQAVTWALGVNTGHAALIPKEFIGIRSHHRLTGNAWAHGRYLGQTEDGALSIGMVVYDDGGRVLAEIDEIRVTPVETSSQSASDPIDDLLYRFVWRQKDLSANAFATSRDDGAWLLLANSRGIGRAIAGELGAHRETCVQAIAGTKYTRNENGEYHLDPADASQLRQLLNDAFGSTRACKGVIHALSLDSTPFDKMTPETLESDLRRSTVSAIRLTQTLLKQGWRDVPRLYFVTAGVHSIGDAAERTVGVAQAPLWGLGRTIALEHPAFECTRIDLPATPSGPHIEKAVREIMANEAEDQIAIRTSGRFVLRLARDTIASAPSREFAFRADRTYLITGGLGGLGLELAQWMVAQGAQHLLLLGRNAPSEKTTSVIDELARGGAKIAIARADVSQRESLRAVLFAPNMPPLAGIVHAAGVIEDRLLLDLSDEEFMQVMRPKVLGALNLHALTAEEPLDIFIMYSSVAGVLGSPGQANYSAANAFLDAFAQARADIGVPAMSIAWGPFTDVGMAAAQGNRGKRLAGRGIEGISPGEGHEIVSKLLNRPRPQSIAVRLSVRQWQEVLPQAASLPMLAELRSESGASGQSRTSALAFRQLLESTESVRRGAVIRAHVVEQVAHVLRLDPARIDTSSTFASLGVDSLTSLELRDRLQATVGLELQPTLAFSYPTLDKLVTYIIGKLNLTESAAAPEVQSAMTVTPTAAANEQTPEMNVDDLLALLDEELSATKKRG